MNTQDNSEERKVFEAWAHESAIRTDLGSWEGWKAATQRQQERIAGLQAQVQALSLEAKRLDWLEAQGVAYGFQDMHEGNRWVVEGPFATARKAIDAAIAAGKGEG